MQRTPIYKTDRKPAESTEKEYNCIIKMRSTCKRYVNHQNIEMIATKETAIEFCNRNPDYYYIEVKNEQTSKLNDSD